MALEAVALDQGEDALHLALVVDVLGEDVLVERVAGRAVDEEEAVLAEACAAVRRGTPSGFSRICRLSAEAFELLARPEDGALGGRVEAVGVEHRPLVVIAEQDDLALHHQIDALARIGAVADDVAEAVDLGDVVFFDVLEDGLQRLQGCCECR